MRFRKLRIAWSVAWGVVVVLVAVLWVRSYSVRTFAAGQITTTSALRLESSLGRVEVETWDLRIIQKGEYPWRLSSDVLHYPLDESFYTRHGIAGFYLGLSSDDCEVNLPHWFLFLVFSTVAALPWLRFYFTLRTLLIATTLVAVVLGLIVAVV